MSHNDAQLDQEMPEPAPPESPKNGTNLEATSFVIDFGDSCQRVEKHKLNRPTKEPDRPSRVEPLVDDASNVFHCANAKDETEVVKENNRGTEQDDDDDAASGTATYVIEEEIIDDNLSVDIQEARKKIGDVFGVVEESSDTMACIEWLNNNSFSSAGGVDYTECSPSSSNPGCTERRRLPATPSIVTSNYLDETVSLMTSMDARLSRSHSKSAPSQSTRAARHGVRLVASASKRNTNESAKKEDNYAAWLRRKSYNPMKSAKSHSGKVASCLETDPESGNESRRSLPARVLVNQSSPVSKQTASSAAFTRSRGGRSSLRSSQSVALASVSRSMHMNDSLDVRRASSLSSTAAEFHSWKMKKKDCAVVNGGGIGLCTSNILRLSSADEFFLPVSEKNETLYHRKKVSGYSQVSALDTLVPATILSVSSKLCLKSADILRKAHHQRASLNDSTQNSMVETLVYVLEDMESPHASASPTPQTQCGTMSWELSTALRNLKKLEQALNAFDQLCFAEDDETNCFM